MDTKTYTLKEMAMLLSRKGGQDEIARIMRQIRHWTISDLLRPTGKKHTGTGVSRRYEEIEVRRAALLLELVRYGITITQLDMFDEWIDHVSSSELWKEAVDGKRSVFLEMTWDENDTSSWGINGDQPQALALRHPSESDASYTSAIIINLTKIMSRLKL